LNRVVFTISLDAKCTQYLLAFAKVLAMFDSHNDSTDHFSVSFAFGKVLAANFSPVDLRPMENFQTMSIIDLNSLGNIRALDDSCIVFKSTLNKIGTLV
jgi:hypothetical protein